MVWVPKRDEVCPYCGKRFKKARQLKQYINDVHNVKTQHTSGEVVRSPPTGRV